MDASGPVRRLWLAAALPALAAFLVFSPALKAGFVWDDLIFRNLQLPKFQSSLEAFAPPPDIPMWSESYYRPLVTLSLLAEEKVTSRGPVSDIRRDDDRRAALPHFTSLSFHALTSALVALLALRLFGGSPAGFLASLFAGLVFAIHTANAETACTIAGRSDSLAALFLLAASLALIRGRDIRSPFWLSLGGLLSLLALFSKETALAGAALTPALLYATAERGEDRGRKSAAIFSAPFFAALAVYLTARFAAGISAGADSSEIGGALFTNGLRALGYYTATLAWPWPAQPFVTSLPGWPLAAISVALLALTCFYAARRIFKGDKIPALLLLWFLAALLPALFVLKGGNAVTPVAMRHLYLPGVAFALAAGFTLTKIAGERWRIAVIAFFAVALSIHAGFSFTGAGIWKDDVTLWRTAVASGGGAGALARLNLGNALYRVGDLDGAEENLALALRLADRSKPAQLATIRKGLGILALTRGAAHLGEGRMPEAAAQLDLAVSHLDNAALTGVADWSIYKGLGEALLMRSFLDRSIAGAYSTARLEASGRALRKGLVLSPGNPELLSLMDRYRNLAASAGMRIADGPER